MWITLISLLKQYKSSLIKIVSLIDWYLLTSFMAQFTARPAWPSSLLSTFSFHRSACVLRRSSAARKSWPPMWHVRSSKRPSVSSVLGRMSISYWCSCRRTVSVWTPRTCASSWKQSRASLWLQLRAAGSSWGALSPQPRAESEDCWVWMGSPATCSLQSASYLTQSTWVFVRTWTCLCPTTTSGERCIFWLETPFRKRKKSCI